MPPGPPQLRLHIRSVPDAVRHGSDTGRFERVWRSLCAFGVYQEFFINTLILLSFRELFGLMFFVRCVRLIHSQCLFFLIPIIREKRQEGFDKFKSLRGRDGGVGEGRAPSPTSFLFPINLSASRDRP